MFDVGMGCRCFSKNSQGSSPLMLKEVPRLYDSIYLGLTLDYGTRIFFGSNTQAHDDRTCSSINLLFRYQSEDITVQTSILTLFILYLSKRIRLSKSERSDFLEVGRLSSITEFSQEFCPARDLDRG